MDKEKVTEDLVRQNGNQAAAVVADYAGQGGGGGGSTSGIPTIDKNIQPNIVWREPTEEDLAKLANSKIVKVADLPNGQVPIFLAYVVPGTNDRVMLGVIDIQPPKEGEDGGVTTGDGTHFLLSEDWSLLGKVGEG